MVTLETAKPAVDRLRSQAQLARIERGEVCHYRSTKETKKAETALAELRGRAEAEKEGLRSAAAAAEDRVAAVREQVARLEQELQSYKVVPYPGQELHPQTLCSLPLTRDFL